MNIPSIVSRASQLFCLVLLAATLLPAGAQTVLYRETFGSNAPNPGSTNVTLSGNAYIATDWKLYGGATATDYTTTDTAAGDIISNGGPGAPDTGLANVNTGHTETSQAYGFVFLNLSAGGTGYTRALLDVTGQSLAIANYSALTFSWYAANNSATDAQRVAIQVGGIWYVSASTFTTPASTTGITSPTLESLTFNAAATNWNVLNFTAGTTLSMGSTAGSALSGTITGFGVYIDGGTDRNRIDAFTVTGTAVPEPGTVALALMGLALLLGMGEGRRLWRRA